MNWSSCSSISLDGCYRNLQKSAQGYHQQGRRKCLCTSMALPIPTAFDILTSKTIIGARKISPSSLKSLNCLAAWQTALRTKRRSITLK
jgi:hypothetical protein